MADPASTASPADLQKVLEEYKQMHRECKALTQKMAELDGEMSEHSLVIETIKDMADERKCYRLINGVLVQHSVKDVKPVLSATVANILEQQKKFAERFTFCNKRVSELQSKYNIREASPEDLQKQQQQQAQLQDGAAPSVSQ